MPDASVIDRQHQKLVRMFDELNDAVKSRVPREDIYWIIDDIIKFTRIHFAAEEGLMLQFGYPELKAHQDKHAELIKDALRLRAKLDYVGEEMFTDWLNHWPFSRVLAHIQYADKQVQDHITRSGVKKLRLGPTIL